jgi:hypothetical protein
VVIGASGIREIAATGAPHYEAPGLRILAVPAAKRRGAPRWATRLPSLTGRGAVGSSGLSPIRSGREIRKSRTPTSYVLITGQAD